VEQHEVERPVAVARLGAAGRPHHPGGGPRPRQIGPVAPDRGPRHDRQAAARRHRHGRPPNVALINGEDPPESVIAPRLEAAGGDLERAFLLEGFRREGEDDEAASLCFPRDLDALEGLVLREKVRLVIIDPLLNFVGRCPAGAPRGQRAALAGLHQHARQHSYAVLSIRHWNKEARLDGSYRGLGGRLRTLAESNMIQMAANPALAADEALIQVADPGYSNPAPPLVVKRTVENGQLVVRLGAARPDLHIPVRLPGIAGRPRSRPCPSLAVLRAVCKQRKMPGFSGANC
jgi:hypothetical protein